MVARELAEGEGALLLHLDTDAYHRLNRTGALLWEALASPATIPELAERLAAALGEEQGAVGEDVAGYVRALRSRDLVLSGEGPPP